MRGMPERCPNHEKKTQAQPECDATHHEHDCLACRDATTAMVFFDRTDKSPRRQGEDAECNEDGDRKDGYAHRLSFPHYSLRNRR